MNKRPQENQDFEIRASKLRMPYFHFSVLQATNEEFKEEFAQAQRTSYGQTAGSGQTFLNDLGYDGLGGYGLGLQEDNDDSDPDGLEPFEVCILIPGFVRSLWSTE